uniref:Uncharacterized protein n=1 Tax=Peronospora matthiolae TaxID=2874970 RepID=A0AAV1V9J7_9STRA
MLHVEALDDIFMYVKRGQSNRAANMTYDVGIQLLREKYNGSTLQLQRPASGTRIICHGLSAKPMRVLLQALCLVAPPATRCNGPP